MQSACSPYRASLSDVTRKSRRAERARKAVIKKRKKSSDQITLQPCFSPLLTVLPADNEATNPLPRRERSDEVRPTAQPWPLHPESRQIGARQAAFASGLKDPLNYLPNFQLRSSYGPAERNRNESGFRIKRCAHLQRQKAAWPQIDGWKWWGGQGEPVKRHPGEGYGRTAQQSQRERWSASQLAQSLISNINGALLHSSTLWKDLNGPH